MISQNYSLRTDANAIQFADTNGVFNSAPNPVIPDMDMPYDTDRSSSSSDRDRIFFFFEKVVAASELKILSLEKIRKIVDFTVLYISNSKGSVQWLSLLASSAVDSRQPAG